MDGVNPVHVMDAESTIKSVPGSDPLSVLTTKILATEDKDTFQQLLTTLGAQAFGDQLAKKLTPFIPQAHGTDTMGHALIPQSLQNDIDELGIASGVITSIDDNALQRALLNRFAVSEQQRLTQKVIGELLSEIWSLKQSQSSQVWDREAPEVGNIPPQIEPIVVEDSKSDNLIKKLNQTISTLEAEATERKQQHEQEREKWEQEAENLRAQLEKCQKETQQLRESVQHQRESKESPSPPSSKEEIKETTTMAQDRMEIEQFRKLKASWENKFGSKFIFLQALKKFTLAQKIKQKLDSIVLPSKKRATIATLFHMAQIGEEQIREVALQKNLVKKRQQDAPPAASEPGSGKRRKKNQDPPLPPLAESASSKPSPKKKKKRKSS